MKNSMITNIRLILVFLITLKSIVVFAEDSNEVAPLSNQNELLKNFTPSSLTVFKLNGNKFEKLSKAWPVKLEKNGTQVTSLIINRAGVIEERFEPDLASYPAYFKNKKYRVVFTNGNFYYITWSSAKATIKYVLTEKGSIEKDAQKHTAKIESYIKETVAAQSGDRKELAAQKEAAAQAEKMANSLKGKNVKSLAVKWIETPSPLGHTTQIPYGIEAKLADGSYLRTENLGGKTHWDDFKITVKGAEFGEEMLTVSKDARKLPTDEVIVTAQSVHIPLLKATAKMPIDFSEQINLNYSGATGGVVHNTISSGYRGKDGKDLKILVKGYTTKGGKKLNKIEVRDASGSILHCLKMAPTAMLNIYSNGGDGSYGDGSTRGGDGADGGNITIIQDPSVSMFTYNVNNAGGNGGKHREVRLYDGRPGVSGATNRQTGSVSLSW